MQVMQNFEDKKKNIIQALQDRVRIEISINGASGNTLTASSLFLKIIKKDEDFFLMLDSLVPSSPESTMLETKVVLISYKLDGVACAFLSNLVFFQKANRTYIMSFPTKIYRLQRRMYFRVNTTIKSMITVASDNVIDGARLPVYDISEGGISFFAKPEYLFEVGAEYNLSMLMYNGAVLKAFVKVRNIIENVVQKQYKLRVCAEFNAIDGKSKEIIAKYVFARQMEEIHKLRGE